VILCNWLHCDLWPFPQVSDPGPFGPSCFKCLPKTHYCMFSRWSHLRAWFGLWVCRPRCLTTWMWQGFSMSTHTSASSSSMAGLGLYPWAWRSLVSLATVSRAWCKTIVTPYIKGGSYNSFAPSPRYAFDQITLDTIFCIKFLGFLSFLLFCVFFSFVDLKVLAIYLVKNCIQMDWNLIINECYIYRKK